MPHPAHVYKKGIEARYDGVKVTVTKTESLEVDTRLILPHLRSSGRPPSPLLSSESSSPPSPSRRTITAGDSSLERNMGRLAITDGRSGETGRRSSLYDREPEMQSQSRLGAKSGYEGDCERSSTKSGTPTSTSASSGGKSLVRAFLGSMGMSGTSSVVSRSEMKKNRDKKDTARSVASSNGRSRSRSRSGYVADWDDGYNSQDEYDEYDTDESYSTVKTLRPPVPTGPVARAGVAASATSSWYEVSPSGLG
ncbi:hypothetical protein BJY01DRAFT_255525 [Aspergillus pseudoustus]|uniref:DUF2439 domain-containing protein n=1 Tax=Aspergillus pseudoustus TaxID=1810923 RepID=A0ABR4IMB4_9EURO